jgi:hypothetical protein
MTLSAAMGLPTNNRTIVRKTVRWPTRRRVVGVVGDVWYVVPVPPVLRWSSPSRSVKSKVTPPETKARPDVVALRAVVASVATIAMLQKKTVVLNLRKS